MDRIASRTRPVYRAALGVAIALPLLGMAGGCSALDPSSGLGYYAQSIGGHLSMLRRARPIADWLADPQTPATLRQRLLLAQRLRRFAVDELHLPDNASYTRYADLGRPAAVWNVVAAPELSLTLKTWCFPVMGCVGYRGYFDRQDAEAEAAMLREQGLDVGVYGVPAYSTLGWTNWLGGDPLLNTFVRGPEVELARLVFHELAHQVAYAADDTAFNESYATAVERLGLARWLTASGRSDTDQAVTRRRTELRALAQSTRASLAALYASGLPDGDKRRRKAELLAQLRAGLAALKAGPWAGYSGYDEWVAQANNATLAMQAAYDGLVPAFENLFRREGGDFVRFHAEVKRLSALPRDERRAALRELSPPPLAAP